MLSRIPSQTPAVEALIAAGADANTANSAGSTPLHLACVNKRAEVVAALLRAGAARVDVNAKNGNGACALQHSARCTQPRTV